MGKKEIRTYIGVLSQEINQLKVRLHENYYKNSRPIASAIATLEHRVKELAHIEYLAYPSRRTY